MRLRLISVALACLLAFAPAAGADTFLKVFDYYRDHNGKIPPCAFTAKQLQAAEHGATNDLNQYGPDFLDAVQAALQARTKGACVKSAAKSGTQSTSSAAVAPSTSTPAAAAAPAATATPAATASGATGAIASPTAAPTTPQPAPTPAPAPAAADNAINAVASSAPHSSGGKDAPAPLIVLAILGGLLALAALALALMRAGGTDPPWLERARHASAEAGWRASAAWAEFTDWVRLGR